MAIITGDGIGITTWQLLCIPVSLYFAYLIAQCIYNVYFHPLAHLPGPRLAAATELYLIWICLSGSEPTRYTALHEYYGDVVRTGPNTVSFVTTSSWKDIYSRLPGRKPFLKHPAFYSVPDRPPNIVTEQDPVRHAEVRKMLSASFSARALKEQEVLLSGYIDQLIRQMNAHREDAEGVDMVHWYSTTLFDSFGDLAFGEPFGSLKTGELHEWISVLAPGFILATFLVYLQRITIIDKLMPLFPYFSPRRLADARVKGWQYAHDKLTKRLETQNTRADFISRLIEGRKENGMTFEQLQSECGILVLAGSETSMTLLSGATYYLCRTPHAYTRLVEEVRSAFGSYDEITAQTTENLKYLHAVLDEGLRIYPPVAIGNPRVSPGETVDGIFIPEGTEVFTHTYAASHIIRHFHEPHSFKPERWLDPDCMDTKEASQPFLLGPRVCLGRNLAIIELRLILAKIFWLFDMEFADPKADWLEENTFYGLWVKPPLRVRLTRRSDVKASVLDD